MADDQWGWAGKIVGYVVLPIVAVVLIFQLVRSFLGLDQQAAIDATSDQISQLWLEYEREYEDFLANDGTIDENERALLSAKLGLVEKAIDNLGKAIRDETQIAIVYGALVATAITFYYTLKFLKSGRHPGASADAYLKKVAENIGKSDPNADGKSTVQGTVYEFQMMFELTSIMDIADQGNVGLASSALNAYNNFYLTDITLGMQNQYAMITAQLAFFTGMQLAIAQFMLTQLNYYLTYYMAVPPPIITIVPLLPV